MLVNLCVFLTFVFHSLSCNARHNEKFCFDTLKRVLELRICAWNYPLLLYRSSGKTGCKPALVALVNIFIYKVWIDSCVFSTRLFWGWTSLSKFFSSAVALYIRSKIKAGFWESELEVVVHNTNSTCFSLGPMLCFPCNVVVMRLE